MRLKVLPPDRTSIPLDLPDAISRVLRRTGVPFQIEPNEDQEIIVNLADADEKEHRFAMRILMRAGYDVEVM